MSWDALAAVAELLGAIGVLASLVYLGIQIRHITQWLKQQAFQLSTNEARRWASNFSRSSASSALFIKGQQNFSSLSSSERFQFTMMLFETLSVWETYRQHGGDDLLGLRESAETSIGSWIRQGWFPEWWESNAFMFPPEYKLFVQGLAEKHSGSAQQGAEAEAARRTPTNGGDNHG
jgi:hypothetical protein